jgi:hypothetical protein
VKFEIDHVQGPFELCHCNRCRKVTGAAFFAGIYVNREDFRLTEGQDLIKHFEAPILRAPPPYRVCFCSRCGSPLPDIFRESNQLEIPAGLLDDDPGLRPDKHIFVEVKSPWFEIKDDLPQMDRTALRQYRESRQK